jgi:hypothetical protein
VTLLLIWATIGAIAAVVGAIQSEHGRAISRAVRFLFYACVLWVYFWLFKAMAMQAWPSLFR